MRTADKGMSRYDELIGLDFPEFRQLFHQRDTILYALGVGAGESPFDPFELQLTYEKDLIAIPSMVSTLALPALWYGDLNTGLDQSHIVHAAEHIVLHKTLPVAAEVKSRPKIVAIYDKGKKGSLIISRRDIRNCVNEDLLATVTQTAFCRGDGELGGPIIPSPAPRALPERTPDNALECRTFARSALIYRLSGDSNPLHVDPAVARKAGFEKPILHGLATYGTICRHLMRLGLTIGRIAEMDCRFTGPVMPGDTLVLDLWREDCEVLFRAKVGEKVVIDTGYCRFEQATAATGRKSEKR